MTVKTLLSACASVLLASSAQAGVDLIAIGSIDPYYADLSAESSALLENGVVGNRFGGIGSGIAYAGGNTFLALPDRGPNAKTYNANVDDTTSFIPRFHTLKLVLQPNDAGAALPFTLTPQVLRQPCWQATHRLSMARAKMPASPRAPRC